MKRNQRHAASFLKASLGLCLAVLVQLGAQGQSRLSKVGWQLEPALSDDFDDTTPLSAKWELLETSDRVQTSFNSFNTWDNVVKKDGCVVFKTKKQRCFDTDAHIQYYYSTASLKSKYDEYPSLPADKQPGGLLYGMYEIRCKVSDKAGQYPCFWLSGQTAWPPELDVFEYNGRTPTMFFSTIHYRNPAYDGQNSRDIAVGSNHWLPYKLADDFHTWTVVWTPTSVAWFFDGQEVQLDEAAQHIPGSATWGVNATNRWELYHWEQMNLIFGTGLNYPDPEEEEFSDFIVDYVHVYKPASLVRYTAPGQPQNAADYYNSQLLPAYQAAVYKTPIDYCEPTAGQPYTDYESAAPDGKSSVCKLPHSAGQPQVSGR